jgi:hypothetical protein
LDNKKERWVELAELAANEQDPTRLMALVSELNELLAHKPQRAPRPDSTQKANDAK